MSCSHAALLRRDKWRQPTDLRTSAQLCWKAFTSAGIRGPCRAASASAFPMFFTSAAQHCSSACVNHATWMLEDARQTAELTCNRMAAGHRASQRWR